VDSQVDLDFFLQKIVSLFWNTQDIENKDYGQVVVNFIFGVYTAA